MKNLIEKFLQIFEDYKKSIDWIPILILFIIFSLGSQLDGINVFNFIITTFMILFITICGYIQHILQRK